MEIVSPSTVDKFTKPTEGFLCPLSANVFDIEFLQFTISDYESKLKIFEVSRNSPPQDMSIDFSNTSKGEDMYRKIKYEFSEDVLRLPHIETSLVFSVGAKEVKEFRMIEIHYFRNTLIKKFTFQFGFCIPGSTNTWDTLYSLPALNDELINDMINHPFETKSDSFYFANGQLIMHNKASYRYIREDSSQAKKSYEDKFGCKGSKDVTSTFPCESKLASTSMASKTVGSTVASYSSKGLPDDPELELDKMDISPVVAESKLKTAQSNTKALKEVPWSKHSD